MYAIIIKALLAGVILYVIRLIIGRKGSENPFKSDCRRKVEPLVTDRSVRRSVIKQRFTPQDVPKQLDAIVIGSGIGGLSTAALLAKAGKKVLVLEQLNKAGGCTHTFKEKGVEFDVGIHYIGEMMKQTMMKTYVDQITEGQIQWASLEDPFDVVTIGEHPNLKQYEIRTGANKIKKLKEYFPNEGKVIDKFFADMNSVGNSYFYFFSIIRMFPRPIARILTKLRVFDLMPWSKYSKTTLHDYLCDITENQDLRDVLAYCFGDYGTLPKDGCIGHHAGLWKHFYHGAAYPIGGASEIAMHIIPVIEKAGGKVLTSANVEKILLQDGKAVGVLTSNGKSKVEILAPVIISAAGVHNTFNKLLPIEAVKDCSIMDVMSKMKHAISGFSVFVGLNGSNEELQLKAQNIWAYTDNEVDKICRDYFNLSAAEAQESKVPLMFISFPSAKDPTWESRFPGKSTMALVTLARYEWFENWKNEKSGKRNDEYNQLKDIIGENMVQQALKLYPHLKDAINDVCAGSPITNDHYIASPRGEIYGLDHTCYRFSAEVVSETRPQTEIPGLYISGQDTIGSGFAGALYGGLLCASSVLNRILVKDLDALHSQIKKDLKKK